MNFKRISLDEIREIEKRNGKPMTFASKDLRIVGVAKSVTYGCMHETCVDDMIMQSRVLCMEIPKSDKYESPKYLFVDYEKKELVVGSGISFCQPNRNFRHVSPHIDLSAALAGYKDFFQSGVLPNFPTKKLDRDEAYVSVISNLTVERVDDIASEYDNHTYPLILKQLRNHGGKHYWHSDHCNSSDRNYYYERKYKNDEILPEILNVDQLFAVTKGFRECIDLHFHYEEQDKKAYEEKERRENNKRREEEEKYAAEKKKHLIATEPTFAALDALTAGT